MENTHANNERRIEIGRDLLLRYEALTDDKEEVDEATVRDAVCDILHAATKDGLIKLHELDVALTSCADHVRVELEEDVQKDKIEKLV